MTRKAKGTGGATVKLAQPVIPNRLSLVVFKDAAGVEVGRVSECECADETTVGVAGEVPEAAVSCDLIWGTAASYATYGVPLAREE